MKRRGSAKAYVGIPNVKEAGPTSGPAFIGIKRTAELFCCGEVTDVSGGKEYNALVCNGALYRAGMNVRLNAPEENWIVRINAFVLKEDRVTFRGEWYYTREQVIEKGLSKTSISHTGRRYTNAELNHELFPTKHQDENSMMTVLGRCYVMDKKDWKSEYSKYPFLFFAVRSFDVYTWYDKQTRTPRALSDFPFPCL